MPKFEAIANENGTVYKLRGRLSKNKMADIAMVPKTKMAYMHINDYTHSWDDGVYDKNCSKFVSLSMKEAAVLRQLMSTMDEPVQALIKSAPPVSKRRKTEKVQQIPSYVTSGQVPAATNANDLQPQGTYNDYSAIGGYGQQQAYDPEQPTFGGQQQQAVTNSYFTSAQQPNFLQSAGQYQTNVPTAYATQAQYSQQLTPAQQFGQYQNGYPIGSVAPVQQLASTPAQQLPSGGQYQTSTVGASPAPQQASGGQYQINTVGATNEQDYINQLFAAYQ